MQKGFVKKVALLSFTLVFSVYFFAGIPIPRVSAQTLSTDPSNASTLEQEINALRAAGYNAPELPAGYSDIDLSTDISPENPGPNTSVSISIQSYSTDLSKATIAWYVNGSLIQNKVGGESFNFTTGDLGTKKTIAIVVNDIEGNSTTKTITIIPGKIDLLWQATDSYVPPFYEGKALYPNQGTIRIVAIPTIITTSGTQIDPNNLTYAWEQDGQPLANDSGYGKDSIVINNPIPEGPSTIDVKVSTLDNTIIAENQLVVEPNPSAPQVILYEKDPLAGVQYQNALTQNFDLTGTEATLAAIPYFFSTVAPLTSVNYKWSLNGSVVPNQTGNLITIRNQNNQSGNASLSVSLSHKTYQFQSANSTISVGFNNSSASPTGVSF